MKRTYLNFTLVVKIISICISIALVFIIIAPKSFAVAGINRTINFQGKVVNKTAGTNVANGNYDFTFRLYDAASSGTLLWTENWTGGNQITVADGIFRANLGSIATFASAGVDFNSDSLYLDITFNSETMGTRVRFSSVPYAINAEKVSGLTVTNNGGNTLNIAANKTFRVDNTLTFTGTDSTSFTLPSTGGGTVLVNNISGQSIAGAFSLTGTSGDLTLAGTTGLTFSGSGGQINFTLGETIDNDTDGILKFTAPHASFSGTLTVGQGQTIRSEYGPLNLAYKSGGDTWTTGLILQDTTGNIGVKTNTPTALLHLEDNTNTRAYQLVMGWNGSEYRLGRNSTNGYMDFTGTQSGFSGYRFYYNSTRLAFMAEAVTGNIGLGTTNPDSELHVTRPLTYGANGKALAIFDQIEDQDIFTASKGGVTKFVIDQNGGASMSGTLTLANDQTIRSAYGPLQLAYKSGGDAWTTGLSLEDTTGRMKLSGDVIFNSASQGVYHTITGSHASDSGNNGGGLALAAGNSGPGSAGNGGSLYLNAGAGGDSGGDLVLDAGVGGNVADGIIYIGANYGSSIIMGSTGITTSFPGRIGVGTTPASTGVIAIPNNTYITARNAANSADINLIKVNASNLVEFGANTATLTLGGAISGNSQSITGVGSLGAATLTTSSTASVSGTLTIGNGTTNQLRSAYGPLQLAYKSGGDAWTTGITLQDTTGRVGIGTSSPSDMLEVANGGITFSSTALGNNGSINVTINAGSTGTTATLLVKLDTSGTVVTTNITTLNEAIGVALDTKTSGQAVRVATQGVVTATADNTVTAGDYVGVGTTTAGRAKSLGTTYPSTSGIQVIGRAISGASAGSTFLLMLSGLDNNAGGGAGGGDTEAQIIFFSNAEAVTF